MNALRWQKSLPNLTIIYSEQYFDSSQFIDCYEAIAVQKSYDAPNVQKEGGSDWLQMREGGSK